MIHSKRAGMEEDAVGGFKETGTWNRSEGSSRTVQNKRE
jgi:hypothetical protein